MKRIPIGDFPLGKPERDALQRVIDSGRISEWREVRAFEEEYADWLGVRHCIAVSSGTAALMCGLKATEYAGLVHPSCKVLIPALTFVATANAVVQCGMKPIFGDVDIQTFCLRTGESVWQGHDIVMPVHLFGYVANIGNFNAQAMWNIRNTPVVEDAAEAHGATYKGKKVGTFGLWSAFSFYIAHTIQAGELGVVCTNDSNIAEIARSIKAHGRACKCKKCVRAEGKCPNLGSGDPRFRTEYIGYNFKPMEFQAALARVQLSKVDENIKRRLRNEHQLAERLEVLAGFINPHYFQEGAVLMAYPIVLQTEGIRDRVIIELQKLGVESRPMFGCIPTQQPAYREYDSFSKLTIANYVGANGFYVGCHQYLNSEDIDRLGNAIIEVVESLSSRKE